MDRRLIAMLCGATMVVLAATGCGGGSETITKAEFIEQAEAVCVKTREEIATEVQARVKEEGGFKKVVGSGQGLAGVAKEVVFPALRREVEEIQALGAPSGGEAEVTAVLNAIERGIAQAEREEEDDKDRVIMGEGPLTKANKFAGEYGLKSCGDSA